MAIQLFEREARRVVPTEAARYLHQRADEIFDLVGQIDIDVARLGAGQVGHLRVGTFDSAGGPLVGRAIARFLVRRRDVEITLDEGEPYELFPRVSDGTLDVALGFEYDLVPSRFPGNLALTEVLTEDLFIVAPQKHRLAGKEAVSLRELQDETWVAHREETPSHHCFRALCNSAGVVPNIAFRSNNLGTVKGIVAAGLALGLIPEMSLRDNHEGIVALPMSQPLPRRHIVAASRGSDGLPLTEAFLQALQRAASE